MDQQLDLDYCPLCAFPTFGHELVVLVSDVYYHRHCFEGTKCVVAQQDLITQQSLPA